GDLPAGASASLTLHVLAPAAPGLVSNTAAASSDTTDTNPENNAATAWTIIIPPFVNVPDIEVSPTGIDFGTVDLNDTSNSANITVTNEGLGNLVIDTIVISDS